MPQTDTQRIATAPTRGQAGVIEAGAAGSIAAASDSECEVAVRREHHLTRVKG